MSRYLQRLAQRSGVTIGGAGRSASAAAGPASASTSRKAPAVDDRSAGIEIVDIIDQNLSVLPSPTRHDSAQVEVARPADTHPSDSDDRALISADFAAREAQDRPTNVTDRTASAPGRISERRESIDALGKGSRDRGSSPGPARDGSPANHHRVLVDDQGRSFYSSSDFGAMNEAADSDESVRLVDGPEAGTRSSAAATKQGSRDTNAAGAPTNLVDQAIQWVVDDPHWTEQDKDSTRDPDNADADRPAAPASSPRDPARVTARTDTGASPATNAAPIAKAANRDTANSEVQVHIGRVSIEIYQPEEPTLVRPTPTAPRQSGAPSRGSGASDSHLRRLYLRGF